MEVQGMCGVATNIHSLWLIKKTNPHMLISLGIVCLKPFSELRCTKSVLKFLLLQMWDGKVNFS